MTPVSLPPPPGCPRPIYKLMMKCWLVVNIQYDSNRLGLPHAVYSHLPHRLLTVFLTAATIYYSPGIE